MSASQTITVVGLGAAPLAPPEDKSVTLAFTVRVSLSLNTMLFGAVGMRGAASSRSTWNVPPAKGTITEGKVIVKSVAVSLSGPSTAPGISIATLDILRQAASRTTDVR